MARELTSLHSLKTQVLKKIYHSILASGISSFEEAITSISSRHMISQTYDLSQQRNKNSHERYDAQAKKLVE